MLNNYLKYSAVIGAAGKMGSGIALLVQREMLNAMLNEKASADSFRLVLMDTRQDALDGLKAYLSRQLEKFAAKNEDWLKNHYPAAKDPIADLKNDAFAFTKFTTDLAEMTGCKMVFEAIIEDVGIKSGIYSQLKSICDPDACFLTNTSSIPIQVLDNAAGLDGRIIGFHFYNPPAVQRLVEIITNDKTDKNLIEMSVELGKRMRKILVPSHDIAGFIGNGHFIRDGLFGLQLVEELKSEMEEWQAVAVVDFISRDYLIRPMGIFQLIDYVGLDVFQLIMNTMKTYLDDKSFSNDIISAFLQASVKGGQFSSGAQKDGFFKYEDGRQTGVYDRNKNEYRSLDDSLKKFIRDFCGESPRSMKPWKALLKDENRNDLLDAYFKELQGTNTRGAEIARRYLLNSKKIAENLVNEGIADRAEDVNAVLMNGFFHLYGPVNDYV